MSRDTTVRCCLKKALGPGAHDNGVDVKLILDIIDEAVVHVSRIAARGSHVALLVVLRTLDQNGGLLPDDFFGTSIDTFFDQCFKVGLYGKEDTCARKPKKKPKRNNNETEDERKEKDATLNKYVIQAYQDAEVASSLANQTVRRKHGDSNLLVYASQTYETNFLNFFDCDLEKRIHTYVKAVWRWKFPPGMKSKHPKGSRHRCCRLAAEPWNSRLTVPDDLPEDLSDKVMACRSRYADILHKEKDCHEAIKADAVEITKKLSESEKTTDDKKAAEKSRKLLKQRRRDLKHRGILWRMELVYWMLKEIDALGCEFSKGFSMAPVSSLQRKHIRIDGTVLTSYLLPRLREIGYYGKDADLDGMESEHLAALFQTPGLRSQKRGWKQGASIQTDGYALCTRFVKGKDPGKGRRTARVKGQSPVDRKKKKEEEKKKAKEEAAAASEALEEACGVGMDMGIVNPYCAAWKASDGSIKHKILSRHNYYLDSGIMRHRAISRRREKRLEKVREAQSFTCCRTADWSRVLEYVATVDIHAEEIWEQYADKRLSRSRMVSEMGKVSVLDRWCRDLRNELFQDGVQGVPLMAVGYPSFNSSMAGSPAAPTTKAFKALLRHFRTLAVDEYMTPQVDPSDSPRLLVKPKIEQEVNGKRVVREVRGIRLCPESHLEPRTTPIVYDREPERWRGYRRLLRDVVGALNMLVVAGKKNEDRPGLLKRTTRYYEATVVT